MANFLIVTNDNSQQIVAEPMAIGTVLKTVPNRNDFGNGGVIIAGLTTAGNQHGYAIAFLTNPQGAATLQSGFGIGSTVHIAPLSNATNSLWCFQCNEKDTLLRIVPWNATSMCLTHGVAGSPPTMQLASPLNLQQSWVLSEFDSTQIALFVNILSWTAGGLTVNFSGKGYLPNAKHNLYVGNYSGLANLAVLPGLPSIQADQNGNLEANSVLIPYPPVVPQGLVTFFLENNEGSGVVTGELQGWVSMAGGYFGPPPTNPPPYPP